MQLSLYTSAREAAELRVQPGALTADLQCKGAPQSARDEREHFLANGLLSICRTCIHMPHSYMYAYIHTLKYVCI